MPVRIYFASKLRHAKKWRDLRDQWGPKAEVVSLWINDPNITNEHILSNTYLSDAWLSNVADVSEADVLAFFVDPIDPPPRGALVEVGVALSCSVPVLACSPTAGNPHDPSLGTWQFHPLVIRVHSFETMVKHLERLMQH